MTELNITKTKLWSLLGEDALTFASWLISDDNEAKAFKVIFDSIDNEINILDPMVQNILLPLLITRSVIGQSTISKINQLISENIVI